MEGHPYWIHIMDWLEKMEKQQSAVSRHPAFEWVDRTMHAMLSGSQSSQSQVGSPKLPFKDNGPLLSLATRKVIFEPNEWDFIARACLGRNPQISKMQSHALGVQACFLVTDVC